MPSAVRQLLGAAMALLGVALAAFGAWTALKLGPSGEAHFSATSKSTGAIVVEPDVLNSLNIPVRVKANRTDGGGLWMAAASSADARAVLARRAVSTVSGVHYPAGTLDLRASGSGALPDISKADVWRISTEGEGSAEMVVDQGRAPETVVLTSGDATALTNVTITLTWAKRAWFFEALSAVLIGGILAAFALFDLGRGRHTARRIAAVRARRSGVRA